MRSHLNTLVSIGPAPIAWAPPFPAGLVAGLNLTTRSVCLPGIQHFRSRLSPAARQIQEHSLQVRLTGVFRPSSVGRRRPYSDCLAASSGTPFRPDRVQTPSWTAVGSYGASKFSLGLSRFGMNKGLLSPRPVLPATMVAPRNSWHIPDPQLEMAST